MEIKICKVCGQIPKIEKIQAHDILIRIACDCPIGFKEPAWAVDGKLETAIENYNKRQDAIKDWDITALHVKFNTDKILSYNQEQINSLKNEIGRAKGELMIDIKNARHSARLSNIDRILLGIGIALVAFMSISVWIK